MVVSDDRERQERQERERQQREWERRQREIREDRRPAQDHDHGKVEKTTDWRKPINPIKPK